MDMSESERHNEDYSCRTEEEEEEEVVKEHLNECSQGDTAVAMETLEDGNRVLLVLNKDGSGMDNRSCIPTAALELRGGSGPPRIPRGPIPTAEPPDQGLRLWSGARLQIQDVVSDVKLGCTLDLDFITNSSWATRYKPQAQNLLMRMCKPRTAARISKSRTRGAKDQVASQVVARRYVRKLQSLGFPGGSMRLNISTLTAAGTLSPVEIGSLGSADWDRCGNGPKRNPWLGYPGIPGLNADISAAAGLGFVGAKTKVQALRVFNICSMLWRFRGR